MISQTSTCEYPIASGFALDARWARNRLQKPWPASCPYNPDVYIDLDHEARGLKHHGASTTKGKASDNSGKKDNNKKPNIEKKKKKKLQSTSISSRSILTCPKTAGLALPRSGSSPTTKTKRHRASMCCRSSATTTLVWSLQRWPKRRRRKQQRRHRPRPNTTSRMRSN